MTLDELQTACDARIATGDANATRLQITITRTSAPTNWQRVQLFGAAGGPLGKLIGEVRPAPNTSIRSFVGEWCALEITQWLDKNDL